MPRSPRFDFQPLLPIRLIDGDPYTAWCSRGQPQPDVEPAWIRIDLAREVTVTRVVLVQRKPAEGGDPKNTQRMFVDPAQPSFPVGCAMPAELEVRLSRDAWHWDTVFQQNTKVPQGDWAQVFMGRSIPGLGWSEPGHRLVIDLPPTRGKQIWIMAKQLPRVEHWGHAFSIAEVEVIDDAGRNVAAASMGAGVTVSSTHYGLGDERESHENLWPVHWDLGVKWVRIGYHDDPFNWHWVEQEKGKYVIDPRAEQALDELVDHGINVVMSLGYGNWLYTEQGKRPWDKFFWEMYYDLAPAPVEGEARQAFLRYVRFVVSHFKDRVKYWEMWNEPNIPPYWGGRHDPPDVDAYISLVRDMVKIVREECPDAKILLGSSAGWWGQNDSMRADDGWPMRTISALAKDVDIVGFHPMYHTNPQSAAFLSYPEDLASFRNAARAKGFNGDLWVTEFLWAAPYPNGWLAEQFPHSEITKAKCMAVVNVLHSALGIVSIWNETWNGQLTWWDVGLMRNTFSADPHSPRQPQPAYYVMRTLCTVMDSLTPADFDVTVTAPQAVRTYTLAGPSQKVIAVWLPGAVGDGDPAVACDVVLPGHVFQQAVGIDLMNGTEQRLNVSDADGQPILKNVLLKDWPVLIRLVE
jgi:hypothetical protein